MTNQERYEAALKRIVGAVHFEDVDRIPVVLGGGPSHMLHVGGKISPMMTDPMYPTDCQIKTYQEIGLPDGVQYAGFSPYLLPTIWLSKVKVPGIELPDDELWQVDEKELMTVDDYKEIINKGYYNWYNRYAVERLDNLPEKLAPFYQNFPMMIQKTVEAGIVPMSPFIFTIPFEYFCGGRTMVKFSRDLYKHFDLVKEASEVMLAELKENIHNTFKAFKPLAVWLGAWRSASEFVSPKFWDVLVFPYYKAMAETVLEEGVIPVFHFDSCWDRDVERFLDFPKGCILMPDSTTDMIRARKILGNHMALMGDVPPALLSLGTPDEVKEYSYKVMDACGPRGFILGQGCDIPANAKIENVQAMIEAVHR